MVENYIIDLSIFTYIPIGNFGNNDDLKSLELVDWLGANCSYHGKPNYSDYVLTGGLQVYSLAYQASTPQHNFDRHIVRFSFTCSYAEFLFRNRRESC